MRLSTLSASPLGLSTWLGRPPPSTLLTVKAGSAQLPPVLRVLAAACELVLHFTSVLAERLPSLRCAKTLQVTEDGFGCECQEDAIVVTQTMTYFDPKIIVPFECKVCSRAGQVGARPSPALLSCTMLPWAMLPCAMLPWDMLPCTMLPAG
jgi:hypothetical protein